MKVQTALRVIRKANILIYLILSKKLKANTNKKKNNDMANDVVDKVAQQECSNNKCYTLAFEYI